MESTHYEVPGSVHNSEEHSPVIEISDADIPYQPSLGDMSIAGPRPAEYSNPHGNKTSSFTSLYFSVFAEIVAGGCIYTLGQPAANIGGLAMIISTVLVSVVCIWAADQIVKYARPPTYDDPDVVLGKKYPKYDKPIQYVSKATAFFIMYTSEVVQPMMFLATAIQGLFFYAAKYNTSENLGLKYSAIIAFVLQHSLSLITETKYLVDLNALGMIGCTVSTIAVSVFCFKQMTKETLICYGKTFVGKTGAWNQGIGTGIFAVFSFCGVLISNFYIHCFLALTFSVAEKPQKNRKANLLGFSFSALYYLYGSIIEVIPYSCLESYPQGAGNFMTAMHGGWGITNNIGYLGGTLLGIPIIFGVTRQQSIFYFTRKKRYYMAWDLILNLSAFAITYKNINITTVMNVGALLGGGVWVGVLPCALDYCFNPPKKIKLIGYIIFAVGINVLLVLQLC